MLRYFKYIGPDVGTRGDYGVCVRGGHNTESDPEGIYVFDPDYGDSLWGQISSPDFVEITKEAWENL